MKKFGVIILSILLLLSLAACFTPENDKNDGENGVSSASSLLEYSINDDGITCAITGMGKWTDEKLVIPSSIGNYAVTIIDEGAFDGCDFITEAVIPDTVIEIGGVIFNRCVKLKKISYFSSCKTALPFYIEYDYSSGFKMVETIEYGVEVLGERFFADTPRISTLILTDKVKKVEPWIFASADGVNNLIISASVSDISENALNGVKAASIQVDKENVKYEIKSGCLINKETKELLVATNGCTIPGDGSVTRIGTYAFAATEVESIVIPNTIRSIGTYAFFGCDKLREIFISEGVKSIEGNVFCFTNYHSIEVDAANPVYHSSGNCLIETATKTLISGSEFSSIPTDGSIMKIGERAFYGMSPSKMILPGSIVQIDDYAFYVWQMSDSKVFYEGSISDFRKIVFGQHYEFLSFSTIYIYSDVEPSTNEYDCWWHYDSDGNPVIWESKSSGETIAR